MIHLYSHKGLLQVTYSNWNVSVMQLVFSLLLGKKSVSLCRAVARTLIGGCIFVYSGSARLTSVEINFISKETSRARPEYMNIHFPPPPPINALATALSLWSPYNENLY